ncbi:porin [Pseudoduganella namucuonensis]|uniref:Outer membrane protein (Porin) n=1 Tax=Pseudoduganella namucuonensis TaxID=1035707 RepID=A0A1I7LTG0_9BURK|nr:porin [Pseudoduganella namucuonensis]SFV12974.1 Outer membrane protein (porin) [Pseudoduganella namucuonensis]
MKTTLGMLAMFGGLSGTAMAQSNVTMYGVADVGLTAERGGAAGSVTKITSGIANGSRIGFKGTEDLGDGLSAQFVLENGMDMSTGAAAQGGLLFGRQAYVGLSSKYGGIRLGRQYTPVDDVVATTDPFYNGFAGRMQNVLAAGYVARVNNDIMFSTPVIGGVSANLAYGFGEVAGDTGAGRYLGASIGYAGGPLWTRLAWQSTNNPAHTGAARNALLGVIYDFGGFRLHGVLSASRTRTLGVTTLDARDGMLGVSVRMGSGTILASYVRRDDRLPAGKNASQLGVGYTYDLSKRTSVYTAYGRIDNDNGAAYTSGNATEAGSGNSAFNLGLRHRF